MRVKILPANTLGKIVLLVLASTLGGIVGTLWGGEADTDGAARTFHVSTRGDDRDPGTEAQPFATLQKAADLLKAGDQVVVEPGVYRQSMRIDKLSGAPDKPITIRARIPRTCFLLGSVPLAGWRLAAGTSTTYTTALPTPTTLVYERDTNREYIEMADKYQVDETAGSFMYDEKRHQLFIHTSDDAPPIRHQVEASVMPMGFDLYSGGPADWHVSLRKHIIIEGFVLEGFARAGIHINRADSCEARDCVAHHCGAGIFMHSAIRSAIRQCEASWCYDRNDNEGGGIAFRGNCFDNAVEECVVHDIIKYGIRHYGAGSLGSVIRNCLAYRIGRCAIHTKMTVDTERRFADKFTPPASNRLGVVENNVSVEAAQSWLAHYDCWGMRHNTLDSKGYLLYRENFDTRQDTQLVFDPAKVDEARFADPAHYDYRLQSDSPWRGKDAGAFPYAGDVFYVKMDGDDGLAGTSVASAWRDVAKAMAMMKPGQTLYVLPGRYGVSATVHLSGGGAVSLRAHGEGEVVFDGAGRESALTVEGQGTFDVRRIRFIGYKGTALSTGGLAKLTLRQCVFDSNGAGAAITHGGRVEKCVFYANRGAGVSGTGGTEPIMVYGCVLWENGLAYEGIHSPVCDFNLVGGGMAVAAFPGDGTAVDLAQWRSRTAQDLNSFSADPRFRDAAKGDFRLAKESPGWGRGYLWSPAGFEETPHHWFDDAGAPVFEDVRTAVVTPTSANLSWRTVGAKSTALVRYGSSKENLDALVARTTSLDYANFHAITLFGLKPSTTFYYQVGTAPHSMELFGGGPEKPLNSALCVWHPAIQSFTTPDTFSPKRRTLHVSGAAGDDGNDGLSKEKPFASLHKASQIAEPGDRIVISAGEYFGLLRPVNSGLPDAPIIFEAAPGERVELSGKRLIQPRSVLLSDKAHIVLRGFSFKEHGKMLQDDIGLGAQCTIWHSRDISVEQCLFDGRMYYMTAALVFRSGDVRFVDNAFYIASNYTGIVISGNPGPVLFDHNTFYCGATSLGSINANTDITFTNNIFGEKTKVKWMLPKFWVSENAQARFDHNYYAFHEENRIRSTLKWNHNGNAAVIEAKGEEPLTELRKNGVEEHGRVGPLPWARSDEIERKNSSPRGVEPADRTMEPLDFADFLLLPASPCRGTASDGTDPGSRAVHGGGG